MRPGRPTIRVWSAGCATGEEPYTLALLAAEAFAPAPPPVDVLGTDISAAALAAAAAGGTASAPSGALDDHAAPALPGPAGRRQYLVGKRLRGLVRFRRHNLVRDPTPAGRGWLRPDHLPERADLLRAASR